jgi:phytoene dehydrogenase-like protein
VGGGPNGLAAALFLAEAGLTVTVLEAKETIGGGSRSAELTLPGFVHDVCSAVHPFAAGSPYLSSLPLDRHGLRFVHPASPVAHPMDDGTAVMLERSVPDTADGLGADGDRYRHLMEPLVRAWPKLFPDVMAPVGRLPRHPLSLVRFGVHGMRSAVAVAGGFDGERARALFVGLSAHSMEPLDRPFTAAVGLLLGAAGHMVGWPVAEGGSRSIVEAMASHLRTLGGRIATGVNVWSMEDVPPARVVLFDVSPWQLVAIAGDRLPERYRSSLERFRRGPGVFKVDAALDGPIPWTAAGCRRAGTVHVGGTMEEIVESERGVGDGRAPERPFVLVAQQSLFDPRRAPEGRHTLWAYCHVPNGSTEDMTERILAQIERFAPGVRDHILAISAMGPADFEQYNANDAGGDISGGAAAGRQLFARPVPRLDPYATPAGGLYLCSASTPPGPGVHGMCGYHAARSALRRLQAA